MTNSISVEAHGGAKPPRPAIVLVDPLSTGVLLQQRVLMLNLDIILVWSDRSQLPCRKKHFKRSGLKRDDFLAEIVHEEGELDATVAAVLNVKAEIHAIMCGSEFGVLLEDSLATALNKALGTNHLKSSGMPDSMLKVDKFLQAEAIRAAGLQAVRQKLALNEQDVKIFIAEQGDNFKAVVKPQTGAGSVGVTFCDSAEGVWKAYDAILAGEHKAHCSDKYKHYESAGVLLQEYLEGTEYIVNAVVHNGVIKCTAVWKYDKRPYNGASFVCYSKLLLAAHDEPYLADILRYTENVLKALSFQNGAVHAEVMYTARGPVLVELNCRLHGGNGAWVGPAELCMGYSQLSVFMDAYLNNGQGCFAEVPTWPVTVNGGCHQVKMRSHVEGTLNEVMEPQLERILELPSYQDHFFSVRPGDKVLLTIDMPSVPGEVTLVHKDKNQLEADYNELNNILHEGIFAVRADVKDDETAATVLVSVDEGWTAPKMGQTGTFESDDMTMSSLSGSE